MSGLSLKEMCFVSIIGEGRERREVCSTDCGTFHLPGKTAERYKPLLPPVPQPPPPPLPATSLLPLVVKVLQYSTSTDHPAAPLV